MPKKSKPVLSNRQVKSRLAVLKRKGLYSGSATKAPSSYAKKLVSAPKEGSTGKFARARAALQKVLSGSAKTVKVKRSSVKTVRDQYFVRKERAIVETKSDERAYFSKAKGKIVRVGAIDKNRYTREKIRLTASGELPRLKSNQRFTIPFARGKGKIDYQNFTRRDLQRLINEYQKSGKWASIGEYIEITTYEMESARSDYWIRQRGRQSDLMFENEMIETFKTREEAETELAERSDELDEDA